MPQLPHLQNGSNTVVSHRVFMVGIQQINRVKLFRIVTDLLKLSPHVSYYCKVLSNVRWHCDCDSLSPYPHLPSLTWQVSTGRLPYCLALPQKCQIYEGRSLGLCCHPLNTPLGLELCLALGGCPQNGKKHELKAWFCQGFAV